MSSEARKTSLTYLKLSDSHLTTSSASIKQFEFDTVRKEVQAI